MGKKTIYVTIGSSDGKLIQEEWSYFVAFTHSIVMSHATAVHGVWFSEPSSRWQNMCVCVDSEEGMLDTLRDELSQLASDYRQDSNRPGCGRSGRIRRASRGGRKSASFYFSGGGGVQSWGRCGAGFA